MADLSVVNTASVFNSTSGTSTVVPVPAGVGQGHRMVAFVGSIGSSPTITDPTGGTWVKVAEYAPGTTLKTAVYYRDVTAAAEPASYTWAWSASGRNFGYAVAYANADLSVPPTATPALLGDLAAGAAGAAPGVALSANDWLLTLVAGRENPGTDTAKGWTAADQLDAERVDLYSTNTGTTAKLTAAFYDSARKLPAGTVGHSVSPSVLISQVHLWSVRLAAQAAVAGAGSVSAGGPASVTTAATFTRTATETGGTVTARQWSIVSGPMGAGTVIGTSAALSWKPGSSPAGTVDIRQPVFQELAYQLTSTAENSTLNWPSAYGYIEDINDNRGYTGGLVGFCSGTGDMLQLVQQYAVEKPGNGLASYLPKLQECAAVGFGTGASAAASSKLGAPYIAAWKSAAANDPVFRKVQRDFRKKMYWDDALTQALADGVPPLGLAIYYDVLVNHGPGSDSESFGGILAAVRAANTKPSSGGNVTTWLNAVINKRDAVLKGWGDDQSVDGRVFAHRLLVNGGTVAGAQQAPQLNLVAPFKFTMYGDPFTIATRPDPVADSLLGTYVLRYTATGIGSDDAAVTVTDSSSSGGTGGTGGTTPAPVAAAPIAFVNMAYVFNSTAGLSTVVPVPAGTAQGHRMIAWVGSVASAPTITDPPGWVKLAEYAPGSTIKTALYYRDVTADAEPASYTWAWSGNGRNWGYCCAYSGVDLSQAPTSASALFSDVAAGAGVDSPALSLGAGDWLLTFAGGRENPGTDTAKDWTNADPADVARQKLYSSNTGTSAKTAAAWWDSGRDMPAGAAHRTIAPVLLMAQVHLWSVRLAASLAGGGGGGSSDPGPGIGGGVDGTSWSRMGLPRA